MVMDKLEGFLLDSQCFKAELIANNSKNPAYQKALISLLERIESKTFLSKGYRKSIKHTLVYRGMIEKSLFEGFLEAEYNIKLYFSKEAEKKALEEAILINDNWE